MFAKLPQNLRVLLPLKQMQTPCACHAKTTSERPKGARACGASRRSRAHFFELPKVVRGRGVLKLFTSKCASHLSCGQLLCSSLTFLLTAFSDSSHLCLISAHIVGSLTSKLPSIYGTFYLTHVLAAPAGKTFPSLL